MTFRTIQKRRVLENIAEAREKLLKHLAKELLPARN